MPGKTATNSSASLSITSLSAREKAAAFLANAGEFHLGNLPTEQPHPKTRRLSQLAHDDLNAAIALFCEIEIDAYRQIQGRAERIESLQAAINATLAAGKRIFLCGCGATGRLSLVLETLWRQQAEPTRADAVRAFMAGGDFALVRSIENFEDHPEYGARQLLDAGFTKGDLLIACSEGGETPFVIGATERAAEEAGGRSPWFLYCNPDDLLKRTTERSRRVLEDSRISKLNLCVGPMAITGSTRLQATSVLMFAVGTALFAATARGDTPRTELARMIDLLEQVDLTRLTPLIEHEAAIYTAGHCCVHVSREHAITVLTDLTERSPTFSLPTLENCHIPAGPMAWTYLEVPGTNASRDAWSTILAREPRALNWPGFTESYGHKIVLGFDFSGDVAARRTLSSGMQHHRFTISKQQEQIALTLDSREAKFAMRERNGAWLVREHLLLKLILNVSSTLAMGRLGRFEGNVMLWVKSSNNKLIDRSIRYIHGLLSAEGIEPPSYEQIACTLFEVLETLAVDEAAVLKTRDRIRREIQARQA